MSEVDGELNKQPCGSIGRTTGINQEIMPGLSIAMARCIVITKRNFGMSLAFTAILKSLVIFFISLIERKIKLKKDTICTLIRLQEFRRTLDMPIYIDNQADMLGFSLNKDISDRRYKTNIQDSQVSGLDIN